MLDLISIKRLISNLKDCQDVGDAIVVIPTPHKTDTIEFLLMQ